MDKFNSYISEYIKIIKNKFNNKTTVNKITFNEDRSGLESYIKRRYQFKIHRDSNNTEKNKIIFKIKELFYEVESCQSLEKINNYVDITIFRYLDALNNNNDERLINKKSFENINKEGL